MLLKAFASKLATLPATAIALLVGTASQTTSASNLAVVGPIESIDCKASAVQVLGIRFIARDANSSKLICSLGVSASPRYVSIQGTRDAASNVQLDKLQLVAKVSYVAGATFVYVRGAVSEESDERGIVTISGAVIDATFAMPAAYSTLEVVGTQPVRGGIILPTAIYASTDSSLGSGATANSSLGPGVALNSSLGSVTATDSSIGSGVAANSSLGLGIGTSGSLGIDIATSSSFGSGVATNSSLDSGSYTNRSMGSEISTNSSFDSGITTNSSLGSGAALNSSLGSGRKIKSVIGSG